MSLRIGAGFRLSRHVWVSASTPLFAHGRRLAQHDGHGSGNPLVGLIGLALIYALIKGLVAG
jgi:hypothetical protein